MINVIRAYIHMEHLLAIIIARQLTSLCINIHVDIYIYILYYLYTIDAQNNYIVRQLTLYILLYY